MPKRLTLKEESEVTSRKSGAGNNGSGHDLHKKNGKKPGTKPGDRGQGRKTILNDDMIKAFCDLAIRGLPADGICDYLGLDPARFWEWKRKGEAYISAGGNNPDDREYVFGKFVRAFKKALAEYRLNVIDRLQNSKDWRREMTILERRDRKNFGVLEPAGGGQEQYNPDEKFL